MPGNIQVLFVITGLVGTWLIFEKANEPGWKAIIPGYNVYTLFAISWDTKYFWWFLVCGFLALLLESGRLMVGTIMFLILECYHLSRSFRHGIGFAAGLIILGPIFLLILGLDDSCYDINYHSDNPF